MSAALQRGKTSSWHPVSEITTFGIAVRGVRVIPGIRRRRKPFAPSRSPDPPEWLDFLAQLDEPGVGLTAMHADVVRRVWRELRAAVGHNLAVPAAEAGEDGGLLLSWSRPEVYAEINLLPDGRQEWFWKDRSTGKFDGTSEAVWGAPAHAFLQRLGASFGS